MVYRKRTRSKPEVLRIIDEFEYACSFASIQTTSSEQFHEPPESFDTLVNECMILNPFTYTGTRLITFGTGELVDTEIVNSMRNVQITGKDMFLECVSDIIEKASKPLSDVIPRTKVYTFNNRPPVDLNKCMELGSAKADASRITKLFMSLQTRPDVNM